MQSCFPCSRMTYCTAWRRISEPATQTTWPLAHFPSSENGRSHSQALITSDQQNTQQTKGNKLASHNQSTIISSTPAVSKSKVNLSSSLTQQKQAKEQIGSHFSTQTRRVKEVNKLLLFATVTRQHKYTRTQPAWSDEIFVEHAERIHLVEIVNHFGFIHVDALKPIEHEQKSSWICENRSILCMNSVY